MATVLPAPGIPPNTVVWRVQETELLDWPSPNFGERRDGGRPVFVVVHYTAMSCPDAACRTLSNPENEVSAHYLVTRSGEVRSLVKEEHRAWHAGAGRWGNCADLNSWSIGIELDNDGFLPFSAALMDALEPLLQGILHRWDIAPSAVIAHSDLAPGRKIDPGARFDWPRLARAGLAISPRVSKAAGMAPDPSKFAKDLYCFGYRADAEFETLLSAFRLRFRFGHQGPLDSTDMALVSDLASRFPIDERLGCA